MRETRSDNRSVPHPVGRASLAGWLALALLLATPFAARPGWAGPGPCNFRYPSDHDVPWECRTLRRGESLESLFAERWIDVARFNRIDRRHATPGTRIRVPRNLESLAAFTPLPVRYAAADSLARFILVNQGEQFLGAYEHGRLAFAVPVATGIPGHTTPNGTFRVDAAHRRHVSSKYRVAGTNIPYPMHYALRFHSSRQGVGFWIHGRDLPGRPASHGCIGLYDEEMQQETYGFRAEPVLADARRLYEWVVGAGPDDGRLHRLAEGPTVLIMGSAPRPVPGPAERPPAEPPIASGAPPIAN